MVFSSKFVRLIGGFGGILTLLAACTQISEEDFAARADSVFIEWTDSLAGTFRDMAALREDAFVTAWAEHRDAAADDIRALPGYKTHTALAERYEARILYEWAHGQLLYPDFHRGITRNPLFELSPTYDQYLDKLDLTRADYLDLEEFTTFIVRKRDFAAAAIIEDDDGSLNDGTRDLTAKRIAGQDFAEGAIRCFLERDALDDWLENFAADGLTTEPDEIANACPGPETDTLLARVATERAEREGHQIEVFKSVDGHNLELHIFAPEEREAPVPAMVWVHGGGWATGSWSWCGPCVWYKERGLVVAQLEYRLTRRHGSEIPDSYEDTIDAIAWVREHAEELGVDPNRIGVSGFSAGGHLSVSAATFVESDAARPDLAVSISGCMDLTTDPYTVDTSGSEERARALSPALAPSSKAPPIFLANAEDDDTCPFRDAAAFIAGAEEIGGDVTFFTQDGGNHFFLRDPARAAVTKDAVLAFLDANGF